MLARILIAGFIATATLGGNQLKYHNISRIDCDIHLTGKIEHVVHGVVYEIDVAGKQILDKVEGLGFGYNEKAVTVKPDTYAPMAAATEFGLPEGYISQYIDADAIDDENVYRGI